MCVDGVVAFELGQRWLADIGKHFRRLQLRAFLEHPRARFFIASACWHRSASINPRRLPSAAASVGFFVTSRTIS